MSLYWARLDNSGYLTDAEISQLAGYLAEASEMLAEGKISDTAFQIRSDYVGKGIIALEQAMKIVLTVVAANQKLNSVK
jgi:hypothetical protein